MYSYDERRQPMSQPDALPVMDQGFHPGAASVGEQVGVMRRRRTKHVNHLRQNRLDAEALRSVLCRKRSAPSKCHNSLVHFLKHLLSLIY